MILQTNDETIKKQMRAVNNIFRHVKPSVKQLCVNLKQ